MGHLHFPRTFIHYFIQLQRHALKSIPILLTRKLRCSVLLRAAHSSLQHICPASPPPAASRMSQMEGARFIAQEGASQGLWGSGQVSQAVAQRSCLLAGPEAHKTQEESPGRRPMFASSKPCPLTLPSLGFRRGGGEGSKLSLLWNVLQPWCTGLAEPLHSRSFLTPICLPTWTAPCPGSCSPFIQQSITECQVLF